MAENNLYDRFSELALYANENNCASIGVEQMYSPHQIPWTIIGAEKLLKEIKKRGGYPFYITVDVGHQSGQRRFIRPSSNEIRDHINKCSKGNALPYIWLGSEKAYEILKEATSKPEFNSEALISDIEKEFDCESLINNIEKEMDLLPHMFADYNDGDTYKWLEKFACYSPIIHLQQTDGTRSSHLPFTPEYNEKGIISGDKVLKAIYKSYTNNNDTEMPEKCKKLYLTIEVFSGTADYNFDIIDRIRHTVEYWRKFVPVDGLSVEKLLQKLE